MEIKEDFAKKLGTMDIDTKKRISDNIGFPLFIWGILLLVCALVMFIGEYTVKTTFLGVIGMLLDSELGWISLLLTGVFLCGLCIFYMDKSFPEKDAYIKSIYVKEVIKSEKAKGKHFSAEEIDKIKYKYDPIYRLDVLYKSNKKVIKKHLKDFKSEVTKLKNLEGSRKNKIRDLKNLRWVTFGKHGLQYNVTEGKIAVNGVVSFFDRIEDVSIKDERTQIREKNPDTGRMRKVKVTNYLGVMVNIKNEVLSVDVLNITTHIDSWKYRVSMEEAKNIMKQVKYLAHLPVPENPPKVEENEAVLALDEEILQLKEKIKSMRTSCPEIRIPAKYKNI